MANYTSTASVVLSVNGKQAQQMLRNLQREASSLEKKIAAAAKAGDKSSLQKLQRQLNSTNRLAEQLRGSASSVERVLLRLDKATPKELQRTLKTLQQQLSGIERGSAAWNAHIAKIKAVKAELQRVNATMSVGQGWWQKFSSWLNGAQTAIMALGAAVTGLVMAGRSAVNSYAEMDEQLANTRKYTGMAEEDVLALNEAFKRLDTRTSRAQLNLLAQEAGRLGKNTLEDVQGYVEAADIINVALVDLGEGATQTIAKLTNIFGVEQMLGTKDAMLAVGSTVNVLSQNCTASKPYLVEFAQRMAGIGSQAGLTIPEILAFGAVLDANGQKVEMSATAIQKVLMNLANKNGDFARSVGLDAKQLNETLKHSAKDGLMMFLEALHRIGESSSYENATMVLAPTLKDMGLDAARVSQVLSTLAKHIDEVKWQMGEANKAFDEASSATHEYTIFNNTARASIDKAKKRVEELRIELGEQLYPIMKHIYTSSGIFLRVLQHLVSFVIEYKSEIITLTATIVAYKVAANAATIATKAWQAVLFLTNKTVIALKGGSLLLRAAFLACTGQITKATAALRAFNIVTKMNPWGAIAAAITAGAVALTQWVKKNREARKAQEEQRLEMERQKKAMRDISEGSASYSAKEIAQLELLYKAATDEAKAKEERIKAAEKLKAMYPEYFGQLQTEAILTGNAKEQYDDLTAAILATARARAAADKISENQGRILELEPQLEEAEQTYNEVKPRYDKGVRDYNSARSAVSTEIKERPWYVSGAMSAEKVQPATVATETERAAWNALYGGGDNSLSNQYKAAESNLTKIRSELDELNAANKELAEKYNVSAEQIESTKNTPEIKFTTPTLKEDKKNKFKEEKEWRERQEAENRIAYATGEKDYIAYTRRMDEIAVEFYKKELEHTNLTETERLKITASLREAEKQQRERSISEGIDAENKVYAERVAEAKQFYMDGLYTKRTYDLEMERLEIEHQQKIVATYKEGTKERAAAEAQLQSLLLAQMNRRKGEMDKYKQEFFGDNSHERQAKYDADLAALQLVYQREIAACGDSAAERLRIERSYEKAKLALKRYYNRLGAEDTKNAMQRSVEDSVDWLNSDGGQALTGSLDVLVSGMSAVFSQLSSLIQAELEIQTAAIEKRYDEEIDRAEGNSYQVKKLEKEKEREIAKAKNEANRKMFAMQVIQAVAQTAQNAIAAYGSAAAVPIVGYILAPIAAAMAVAAGAIQIASIKKQQQASEAQGYSEGGFTPEGDKNREVGVVHAGEWVASQRLTHNPRTRPLLEALDEAQRTNRIGSIRAADVSRYLTAPMLLASAPAPSPVVVTAPAEGQGELAKTLASLNTQLASLKVRLSEPFVTVNTVTGDYGIKQAQEEYERLMRNKAPKTKR